MDEWIDRYRNTTRGTKESGREEAGKLRGLQLTRNLAHVPGDSAVNHPGSYSALRAYVTFILYRSLPLSFLPPRRAPPR